MLHNQSIMAQYLELIGSLAEAASLLKEAYDKGKDVVESVGPSLESIYKDIDNIISSDDKYYPVTIASLFSSYSFQPPKSVVRTLQGIARLDLSLKTERDLFFVRFKELSHCSDAIMSRFPEEKVFVQVDHPSFLKHSYVLPIQVSRLNTLHYLLANSADSEKYQLYKQIQVCSEEFRNALDSLINCVVVVAPRAPVFDRSTFELYYNIRWAKKHA